MIILLNSLADISSILISLEYFAGELLCSFGGVTLSCFSYFLCSYIEIYASGTSDKLYHFYEEGFLVNGFLLNK
jgi:hypothetical protein